MGTSIKRAPSQEGQTMKKTPMMPRRRALVQLLVTAALAAAMAALVEAGCSRTLPPVC